MQLLAWATFVQPVTNRTVGKSWWLLSRENAFNLFRCAMFGSNEHQRFKFE